MTSVLHVKQFDAETMQQDTDDILIPSPKFSHTLAISPNGKLLAMGTIDGLVYLIDMKSRTIVSKLESHALAVRALAFTSSSKHLISAAEDLHINVVDTETFQRKRTMVGHTKLITSIACHPENEDIFMTSSCDGTLKQWSMQDS